MGEISAEMQARGALNNRLSVSTPVDNSPCPEDILPDNLTLRRFAGEQQRVPILQTGTLVSALTVATRKFLLRKYSLGSLQDGHRFSSHKMRIFLSGHVSDAASGIYEIIYSMLELYQAECQRRISSDCTNDNRAGDRLDVVFICEARKTYGRYHRLFTQDMMAYSEAPHSSSKSARRRGRAIGRPKEKRSVGKEVLIERTVELLRTLPPEKLSLTLVAKHAGVHLTLFKYYFQDRTRLLIEVARYQTFELGERIRLSELDKPSAKDRLRLRIDTMVDFYFLNPFYRRLMLEIVATEKDVLASEVIGAWMSKTLDIYRDIFGAGVAEGTLRPLDEFFTYLAIMGLCEQFHYSLPLFDKARTTPGDTAEQAAARYKAFLHDFIFNGIAVKPELSGLRSLEHESISS